MNPQEYMQRLAGLSQNAVPTQQTPGYWWNDKRVPDSKPYPERFAGGQNKAAFTPFQGDITRYGMGPQHRFYQADPQTFISTTTGTNTTTGSAPVDTSTEQQRNGGPDGGQSMANERDAVHGKSFDQMTNDEIRGYADRRNNGNFAQRNLELAVPGLQMLGIPGLIMGGLEKSQLAAELGNRGLSNPGDFVGGQIAGAANTGMNVAGGVPNPELAGRSDASQGGPANDPSQDRGVDPTGGGSANPDGGYAEGGVVEGDQVQGQDDVTISADGGEGIIRAKPMTALGEPFLDALNAEDYALAYRLLGEIVQQSKRDATEDSIVAKRRIPQ